MNQASHTAQHEHMEQSAHGGHAGHGVMHEGHTTMMRNRFFVSLPLTIIVLLYSPMIQNWFHFSMPIFPGSAFIAPIIGTIIFFYGGLPFLGMARQEIAQRQPGMMTLISLAITTAYLYSLGLFFFPPADAMSFTPGTMMDFFWELATLITVMLLGHWIELRSVGQAQGALRELAKLLPDTAERRKFWALLIACLCSRKARCSASFNGTKSRRLNCLSIYLYCFDLWSGK